MLEAVPGRETFSDPDFNSTEFGLESGSDSAFDFAELALEDFSVNEFVDTPCSCDLAVFGLDASSFISVVSFTELVESFLSLFVDFWLFAVPGREPFSDPGVDD